MFFLYHANWLRCLPLVALCSQSRLGSSWPRISCVGHFNLSQIQGSARERYRVGWGDGKKMEKDYNFLEENLLVCKCHSQQLLASLAHLKSSLWPKKVPNHHFLRCLAHDLYHLMVRRGLGWAKHPVPLKESILPQKKIYSQWNHLRITPVSTTGTFADMWIWEIWDATKKNIILEKWLRFSTAQDTAARFSSKAPCFKRPPACKERVDGCSGGPEIRRLSIRTPDFDAFSEASVASSL